MIYKIIHRETLVGWYNVIAENEDDALKKYYELVNDGEIDFSDLETVDSDDKVVVGE